MGFYELSDDQEATLTILNVFFSAISSLGSTFIIGCFIAFKDLRKFSFELVFWLSVSDLLNSLGNVLGNPSPGFLCSFQAYSTQFASNASIFWTTVIAYVLHRTVVLHRTDVASLKWHFHGYVWGLSLLLTLIPAFTNSYGPAGAWCWVVGTRTVDKVLRFGTFFLPLWIAIPYNAWVYLKVVRMLRYTMMVASSISAEQRDVEAKAVARLGYYPVILVIIFGFATLNRLQNFVQPDHPLFWLYCAHISTSSLQGLLNAAAYGLNTSVRQSLREALGPLCFCGGEGGGEDGGDDSHQPWGPAMLLQWCCPHSFRPPQALNELDHLSADLADLDQDEDALSPPSPPESTRRGATWPTGGAARQPEPAVEMPPYSAGMEPRDSTGTTTTDDVLMEIPLYSSDPTVEPK